MDRGLLPAEQDEFITWLSEDSRHREAIKSSQGLWGDFDRLAGLQTSQIARLDKNLLSPPAEETAFWQTSKFRYVSGGLAAAAAIAVAFVFAFSEPRKPAIAVRPAVELMARIETMTLADGSTVELNRGAELEVSYSGNQRQVFLKQGEAVFDVAHDPDRPFVVTAEDVKIQALGTVFTVKLSEHDVQVMVTEGKVSMDARDWFPSETDPDPVPLLTVGQRGIVRKNDAQPSVQIVTLGLNHIEGATLWRPTLLDYDSVPLREIVAEFNRRNPIQIKLSSAELGEVELSSSFWSDNVEGFVRLMESGFGMKAEWRGSREIHLHHEDSPDI
ncbi:MAG: FecR family protein [Synoicihabitans sp.]